MSTYTQSHHVYNLKHAVYVNILKIKVYGVNSMQAVHWARLAASAPDSLTAVCPEEKKNGMQMQASKRLLK